MFFASISVGRYPSPESDVKRGSQRCEDCDGNVRVRQASHAIISQEDAERHRLDENNAQREDEVQQNEQPIRWVIVRDPKKTFKTQALLCTDIHVSAEQIIEWFVRRWQVEVTFHEVRTHLGVETQRQWADLSSLRSTPALLGLFSIVTLLANLHAQKHKLPVQQAAWYIKKLPTFSDALSIVKQTLFSLRCVQTSQFYTKIRKVPRFRSCFPLSRSTRTFWSIPFG